VQNKAKRRKMAHASEEMKEWSALLKQELEKLPKVIAKPMFGMLCYYRGAKVFGALPVTRSIGSANSFMFKIKPMPPNLLDRAEKGLAHLRERKFESSEMVHFRAQFRDRSA